MSDPVGTLYVTGDGTVYRLRRYQQRIHDLVNLGEDAPQKPSYDVFVPSGGAAVGLYDLPDDAVEVWRPQDS